MYRNRDYIRIVIRPVIFPDKSCVEITIRVDEGMMVIMMLTVKIKICL